MMSKLNKRKKRGIASIALGFIFITAAIGLGLYNKLDSDRAGDSSEQLTSGIAALLDKNAAPVLSDIRDNELTQLGAADEASNKTISVSGYDVSGIISIPDIGVNLAVISEWSYPNLSVSACRYSGSPDGQMILLAHNYKSHFGMISRLENGDEISFTDVDGTKYSYLVTGIEQWAEGNMREIISGDNWDLTLFTCTYSGTERIVVRCARATE